MILGLCWQGLVYEIIRDIWLTICREDHSASQTILIHSDMHRFSKLPHTWLTAHTIFVSGITFLYCLWVNAAIKERTSMEEFNRIASACSALLKVLGKAWSVAADAVEKFDRLVSLTSSS